MDFNSSDYFSYKKNKMQTQGESQQKPISKLNFLVQLFIATFVVIFIIIVISIMKFSTKIDIENPQSDISYSNIETDADYDLDEEQRKIDKRLTFIQQEENAPYEAKIIVENENQTQVIDPKHIENNKKIDKIEKIKSQNIQSEAEKIKEKISEIKFQPKKEEVAPLPKNVIITSKVLVGRYSTFDEAQKMQEEIKDEDPSSTPFVRKTGDIFSVQMGSYQDFSTARAQAQGLKAKGFDVWIYQQ